MSDQRGRFALATIDQLAPFHRSTSVWLVLQPTAMQNVGAVHDTPLNKAKILTPGVGTTSQRRPFQRSASPCATAPGGKAL